MHFEDCLEERLEDRCDECGSVFYWSIESKTTVLGSRAKPIAYAKNLRSSKPPQPQATVQEQLGEPASECLLKTLDLNLLIGNEARALVLTLNPRLELPSSWARVAR
jgi:hypothetical protein